MSVNWEAYRAHKHKTTPQKAREMLALKQTGITCKQIAHMYGVSVSMVTLLLRRYAERKWLMEDWH